MDIHPILLASLIFVISLSFVTLGTVRMILTLKGFKYLAAGLAVLEVLINITGLGMVLDNVSNMVNLFSYAFGFAAGIVVGSWIEDKLTLGYVTVNVVTQENDDVLSKQLREEGYGVTDWETNGIEGQRRSLQILTPKKNEIQLYHTIKRLNPKAFIVAYEAKTIHGGFWVKTVKKGKLFK